MTPDEYYTPQNLINIAVSHRLQQLEDKIKELESGRIKPESKPDVVTYLVVKPYDTSMQSPNQFCLDNLCLTFDGETGKLKSAEVI